MKAKLFAALLCATVVSGCCTDGSSCNTNGSGGNAGADATVVKLKDIASLKSATTPPPTTSNFYISLQAVQGDDTPIPPDHCVSQNFWTFIRKSVGLATSATVILSAKITPVGSASSITVPIYSVSSSDTQPGATGAVCSADFSNKPITFTYPSTQTSAFDVELTYSVNSGLNSTATQQVLGAAAQIAGLVATGSTTAGAIVTKLTTPDVQTLSATFDSDISNNWTSADTLKYSARLESGADGQSRQDELDLKVPTLVSDSGGVDVSNAWNASITLSIAYGGEVFKSSGNWLDVPEILSKPIVSLPGSTETDLNSLVLNGDTTSGFDWKSIQASTDVNSLRNACAHLDTYLASSFISDDRLAAKFAVLKGSPYELMPNLRIGSDCFTQTELNTTLPGMNANFVFDDLAREARDADATGNLMGPITDAFASGNPDVIKSVLTANSATFFFVASTAASDFYQGDAAIAKLSGAIVNCYQASPTQNLSQVGALITLGGTTRTAIFSFDDSNKLQHVIMMDGPAAAAAINISESTWVDPGTLACKKS